MKRLNIDLLKDEEQLNKYIDSLEEELEKTESVDQQVDLILNNILNLFSNFNDRRALRASNIEAITNMLRLKSELPLKRIQTKKAILDILTKKKELEIKEKSCDASYQLAGTAGNLLLAVFNKLDQNNIHPEIDDHTLEAECHDIIDTQQDVAAITSTSKQKPVEYISVEKLQRELDEEESIVTEDNQNGDDNIA